MIVAAGGGRCVLFFLDNFQRPPSRDNAGIDHIGVFKVDETFKGGMEELQSEES